MLTEDETKWIMHVLSEYKPIEISPSYHYKKKTEEERNQNKDNVRKELDKLRKRRINYTPQDLFVFKNKNKRENHGIKDFPGIYIIQNRVKDIYYVGQAERVFERGYKHFVESEGNPEVYKDYSLGDEFSVSLIPLEITCFSSLNELEDNAIRAYDSFQNGYNRMPGNVLDKALFKNKDFQRVATLILDRIKGTELFLSLSNRRKRIRYTSNLLSELGLPYNLHFILDFADMIKEYQTANKKMSKND